MSTDPANTGSGSGDATGSSRGRGSGGRGRGRAGTTARSTRDAHIGTVLSELFTRPQNLVDKKGTSGIPSDCQANFVAIETPEDRQYFQFHVGFEPEVDSKQIREKMLDAARADLGQHFIFDGMILYLYEDPGNREIVIPAKHPVTGDDVTIRLRQTVLFGYSDPQAINIYNLLIRRAFKEVEYKQVGRNFFDPARSASVDQYKLEIWPGYETAVRLHEEQLLLCVENRFKVLRKQTVLEMLEEEYRRSNGAMDAFKASAEMLLVDQTVITLYNNRLYKISKIDWTKTPADTFHHEGLNREVSFAEYFKTQYDREVTDMHQPLLVSEGAPKQPGGDPQMTFLIPEYANLTGLTDAMRNDGRVMKYVSQYTRMSPIQRRQSTEAFLARVRASPVMQEILEAWRMQLGDTIVDVKARQLPPQKMIGGNNRSYEGQRAEWARHVRQAGNFRSQELVNWILVCPSIPTVIDLAKRFISETQTIGQQMGMTVGQPMCDVVSTGEVAAYSEVIKKCIQSAGDEKVHMIVVLLNDDSKTRYDALKKMLSNDIPIPTQMVLVSTLAGKPQDRGENKNFGSIVLKIIVQMNCKMGGAAWKVNIPLKNSMIVGYDLYHDSTQRGKTVGACVSSYDPDYTRWYSQSAPHQDPTQLGQNLHTFIQNALRRYYECNNKQLPERLFLYRDGCGDGQIPFVKDQEVRQVKEACQIVAKSFGLEQTVKLAFTVVTKKVNMRVFKKQGEGLVNPEPGTVVDSVVTRPERYDFYLVPQYVNQGTVTPVCYNILHDETELPPDRHQMLAFMLSHLYYNWQGTVRVPAPCQYAHKLAFLIAQSIHDPPNEILRDRLFFL